MKKLIALTVFLSAVACSGGLSKSAARDLLKSHYSKQEVLGSLNLGLVSILLPRSETERDSSKLFDRYFQESPVKKALAEGLVSVSFEGATLNDFYQQMDVRYRLTLTEKGRPFEREHDQGTMRQVYWLKVADYIVDEVTGVVTKGNEAKIYYTMSFRGTPFVDIAPPMNLDTNARHKSMTAIAISDGKNWHVQDVEEGTR